MKLILQAPHPILAKPSAPCVIKGAPDKKLGRLIQNMKETLEATHDPEGVGLAAPQVGESVRLFVVKSTPKSTIEVFINPQILNAETVPIASPKKPASNAAPRQSRVTARSKPKQLEGCLSLMNIWGQVRRAPSVSVSYVDEKGVHHEKTFKSFMALIIQHEVDHLDGLLFPKRVLEQKGKLYKSHKNKKGKDVFEEIEI